MKYLRRINIIRIVRRVLLYTKASFCNCYEFYNDVPVFNYQNSQTDLRFLYKCDSPQKLPILKKLHYAQSRIFLTQPKIDFRILKSNIELTNVFNDYLVKKIKEVDCLKELQIVINKLNDYYRLLDIYYNEYEYKGKKYNSIISIYKEVQSQISNIYYRTEYCYLNINHNTLRCDKSGRTDYIELLVKLSSMNNTHYDSKKVTMFELDCIINELQLKNKQANGHK